MKDSWFTIRKAALVAVVLMVGVALAACDNLTDFSSGHAFENEGATGSSMLRVRLVDAPFPFDLVDSANVTIDLVQIQGRDSARQTVTDEELRFNLLDLRDGVSALLGEIPVEPGVYSRALLTVSEASIVLNDGQTFDMKVPSGVIKVLLGNLEIEANQDVTLTLDFDVDKSFVVQGNPNTPAGIKGFLFKPVVIPLGVTAEPIDDDEGEDDGGEEGEEDEE